VARTVAELRRIRDPIKRATEAAVLMDELRQAIGQAAKIRHEAVGEAVKSGQSRSAVARALGVSPQAITNLLNGH
jgi:DNA-binding transcriptional regulator YdaS (Cro superfamily)